MRAFDKHGGIQAVKAGDQVQVLQIGEQHPKPIGATERVCQVQRYQVERHSRTGKIEVDVKETLPIMRP